MSVRASFEADTMAQARFKSDRALSGVHQGKSQISADEPNGTEGSRFRDSLKAYLRSENRSDGGPELARNANESANSASIPSAEANPPDGRGANPDFVSPAGDHAPSLETVLKHLARGRQGKLVLSVAAQKQTLGANRTRASIEIGVKKPITDETATGNALEIRAAQIAMPMVPQATAVAAQIPNKQTGSVEIVIPDAVQNKTTVAGISVEASSSSGFSAPWTNREHGPERGETQDDWPASSASVHSTVSRIDEAGFPEVSGGHRTGSVDDQGTLAQARPPFSSRPDANTVSSMNGDEAQSNASREVVSAAKSDESPNLNRTTGSAAKQELVIPSQSEARPAQNNLLNAERRVDADGRTMQTPASSAAVEAGRDTQHSADSTPLLSTTATDRLARTTGKAKSSSSHSDLSSAHSRDLEHALADSASALAPRSPEMFRVADVANDGSAHPKTIDASASDGRLQNTFSALESGARSEAGAFNWTRTGHIQAEAGYQDPALGWIGIKAEASGGAIHATLIPQSSDAAQVLGGHVAGLHTYLAENHTPVETVSLASSGGNPQQFTGQHPGQEAQQDSGQSASQRHGFQAVTETQCVSASGIGSAVQTASTSDTLFPLSHSNIGSRGVRISVLA